MKMRVVFVGILLAGSIITTGCSRHESTDTASQSLRKEEAVWQELLAAGEAVRHNQSSGLLKLYELWVVRNNAEVAEAARDELYRNLYYKTDLWLRTFADRENSVLLEHLAVGGLTAIEVPGEFDSARKYEVAVVVKLRKFKGKPNEMKLAQRVIDACNLAMAEEEAKGE